MSVIKTVPAAPLFRQRADAEPVFLEKEDYLLRLELLRRRMEEKGTDFVVLYGDREHFSHMEYFTSYDCRFEEALMVVDAAGKVSMIVGNEGWSYSYQIPYEVDRYMYQNFSLQGQPREKPEALHELLARIGLHGKARVGLVGVKYFEDGREGDPAYTFDVPAYILAAVCRVCPADGVTNFTRELTGYPDGIRLRLHSAREIAWAEYAGCRVANAVQNMLEALKPGRSEWEVSARAGTGLEAGNVHPMINFGPRSVSLGLKSPRPDVRLELGQVCGVCYSVRGNLTSKIAVAAYDLNSYDAALRPYYENFYQAHFAAMAAWYEATRVGACCGDLYSAVYAHINHEEHGITLNPGHGTGTEEWLNSAFHAGSTHKLLDGEFLQVDIIASKADPVRTSICEDAVVIASAGLRAQLAAQYPAVWARIRARQQAMRETLGIAIADDVLPMSNLNGVYYPFMLDLGTVLAKKES